MADHFMGRPKPWLWPCLSSAAASTGDQIFRRDHLATSSCLEAISIAAVCQSTSPEDSLLPLLVSIEQHFSARHVSKLAESDA